MSILRKTEDIFKPADPSEIGPRQARAKEEFYKKLYARPKRSIIDDLVDRDMESADDKSIKDMLVYGFKGYTYMDKDELIRIYVDYFGGWEDDL